MDDTRERRSRAIRRIPYKIAGWGLASLLFFGVAGKTAWDGISRPSYESRQMEKESQANNGERGSYIWSREDYLSSGLRTLGLTVFFGYSLSRAVEARRDKKRLLRFHNTLAKTVSA